VKQSWGCPRQSYVFTASETNKRGNGGGGGGGRIIAGQRNNSGDSKELNALGKRGTLDDTTPEATKRPITTKKIRVVRSGKIPRKKGQRPLARSIRELSGERSEGCKTRRGGKIKSH